ncbi:DUF998 domain-containing protein [Janibacter melonis]|uniref:DUF998 domain-containing protein n=1 Tax=Janibacter melonis TaxID=262209 RepID=A0A5P8FNR6_9MICO|nr:DUF998 domain-containing protein [Janibacter melonis]QFQ31226.1 DUF998 domain-containing protein [Janibacter melonis]
MSAARTRVLGLLLLLSGAFVVAEVVTASAWTGPAYSWTGTVISELGRTDCGGGAVPACSPWHGVINAMMLAQGVRVVLAVAVGLSLLRGAAGCLGVVTAGAALVYGAGIAGVGLAPLSDAAVAGSPEALRHGVAALLAIGGGVLVLVLLAATLRRDHPGAALLAAVLAVAGTAGGVGFAVLPDLQGLTERVAVYAPIAWQVVVGSVLLVVPARAAARRGPRAVAAP